MSLLLKRIYEPAAESDGFRILVDRLWPRGLSKEAAGIDLWLKEIAPSHDLRKWFAHEPSRWNEFRNRYFSELDEKKTEIEVISEKLRTGPVTLLYCAKDSTYNQAVALQHYFQDKIKNKWN